ncbi:sugar phosphate nucleotidyltransferase [Micromonospora arborensis]|uniref:sugar phosphate nucleotidyltransferase n=1 Tax=Micromonospora arborensis TaxID=2116518 RepID=UPI0034202D4E
MTAEGVRAALLAGGLGERMSPLTDGTCKPLVPYAASCRMVDFSMSNAARSGIDQVVLLSMHRERELVDHLLKHWHGAGVAVHFGPHDELIRSAPRDELPILPPRPAEAGTADALINNDEYLFAPGVRDILVQHADHIYHYDYGPMVAAHRASGADVTIGVQQIERRFVRLFGMVEVADDLRVRRLVEKPAEPSSDLIFTAFCLFRVDALRAVLTEFAAADSRSWQHDISRDVLPVMIAEGRRVMAYPIEVYWADVGTVERYHLEQMKLLTESSPLPPDSLPRTLTGAGPRFVPALGSLIAADVPALSEADVRSSVLYPGVTIEPGAVVRRSIVLPGTRVRSGVRLADTVTAVDEDVRADRSGLAPLTPVNASTNT